MSYIITAHTRTQAKKLGVVVKVSSNKKKKLDVYKNGKKVASIGAIQYGDYGTFLREKGKEFADKRRKAYKSRHAKNLKVVGSNGWYSNKLLW